MWSMHRTKGTASPMRRTSRTVSSFLWGWVSSYRANDEAENHSRSRATTPPITDGTIFPDASNESRAPPPPTLHSRLKPAEASACVFSRAEHALSPLSLRQRLAPGDSFLPSFLPSGYSCLTHRVVHFAPFFAKLFNTGFPELFERKDLADSFHAVVQSF